MALINFPDSPENGDTFTSGGRSWVYDGTAWGLVKYPAPVSATAGQLLTADGSGDASWEDAPETLPDQSGHTGQFLKTDGSAADWAALTLGDLSGSPSTAPVFQTELGGIATYSLGEASFLLHKVSVADGQNLDSTTGVFPGRLFDCAGGAALEFYIHGVYWVNVRTTAGVTLTNAWNVGDVALLSTVGLWMVDFRDPTGGIHPLITTHGFPNNIGGNFAFTDQTDGKVNLANSVTGILPAANGGFGADISAWTTNNFFRKSSTGVEQRTPAQVRSDIGVLAILAETDAAAGTSGYAQIGNAVALEAGGIYQWIATIHACTNGADRMTGRLEFSGTITAPTAPASTYRGAIGSTGGGSIYSVAGFSGSPPVSGLIIDVTNWDRVVMSMGFVKVNTAGNMTFTAYRLSGSNAPYVGGGSCIVFHKVN